MIKQELIETKRGDSRPKRGGHKLIARECELEVATMATRAPPCGGGNESF